MVRSAHAKKQLAFCSHKYFIYEHNSFQCAKSILLWRFDFRPPLLLNSICIPYITDVWQCQRSVAHTKVQIIWDSARALPFLQLLDLYFSQCIVVI